MSKVVELATWRKASKAARRARGPAEILLFLGVRYERHADALSEAPQSQPRGPSEGEPRPRRSRRRRAS